MNVLLLIASITLGNPAIVVSITGNANAITDTGSYSLSRFDRIQPGTRIKTGTNSKLSLRLPSGSLARVGEDTEIAISKLTQIKNAANRQETISLLMGQMWVKVTKLLGENAHFHVTTDRYVAGVRGTAFWVRNTAGHSRFVLDEGALSVRGAQSGVVELSGAGSGFSGSKRGNAQPFKLSRLALRQMRSHFSGAEGRLMRTIKRVHGKSHHGKMHGHRKGKHGKHRPGSATPGPRSAGPRLSKPSR